MGLVASLLGRPFSLHVLFSLIIISLFYSGLDSYLIRGYGFTFRGEFLSSLYLCLLF